MATRRALTILTLALLLGAVACTRRPEPAALTALWTYTAQDLRPVDGNSDGYDELLQVRPQDYTLIHHTRSVLWQGLRPRHSWFAGFAGRQLVFDLHRGDTARLGLLDDYPTLAGWYPQLPIRDVRVLTAGRKTSQITDYWDGGFTFRGFLPVLDGSPPDLLCELHVYFDQGVRGLLALDGRTLQPRWLFRTGPGANRVRVEDLNGDRRAEVVIGTEAYANGHVDNGTSDSLTYVIALTDQGQPLWTRVVGGYWEGAPVEVGDIDRDGRAEVVVLEQSHREPKFEPDSLMVLDGAAGRTEHCVKVGTRFRGLVLADLDRDGRAEIITGNTDGFIRVFNDTLENVCQYDAGVLVEPARAGDIDGDGDVEIVATTGDGRVLVLSRRLALLAVHRFPVTSQPGADLVRLGRRQAILASQPGAGDEVTYSLLTYGRRVAVSGVAVPGWVFVAVGLLALAAVGGVFAGRRVLRRRAFRLLAAAVGAAEDGMLLTDRRDIVLAGSPGVLEALGIRVGERLPTGLLAGSAPLETRGGRRLKPRRIDLDDCRLYVLEDLAQAELVRRVTAWAPVAQDLGHGIKNPLTTIRLKVQQLARSSHPLREQDLQLILGEVDRLKRMTDGFMRFVRLEPPSCEPTDLNELVRRVASRFTIFPERVELNLAPDLPTASLDPVQVETALANLIGNAVDAVRESGTVSVATARRDVFPKPGDPRTEFVEVEVADTGVGIPEKYRERVFRPYFSLKSEGNGLGLVIAKKIIEDHGGRIELHSREGVGTTVHVWLPLH